MYQNWSVLAGYSFSPFIYSFCVARFNLDPFDKCTDQEVWEAIGIAQLKGTVSNLPDGIGKVCLHMWCPQFSPPLDITPTLLSPLTIEGSGGLGLKAVVRDSFSGASSIPLRCAL